jgi:hypothetical protein
VLKGKVFRIVLADREDGSNPTAPVKRKALEINGFRAFLSVIQMSFALAECIASGFASFSGTFSVSIDYLDFKKYNNAN